MTNLTHHLDNLYSRLWTQDSKYQTNPKVWHSRLGCVPLLQNKPKLSSRTNVRDLLISLLQMNKLNLYKRTHFKIT